MPILLTPEENEEVYDECLQGTPIGKPFDFDGLDNARNKAQLKKVFEWGEETCPHDLFGEGTQCFKHACDECWQSLKKEL